MSESFEKIETNQGGIRGVSLFAVFFRSTIFKQHKRLFLWLVVFTLLCSAVEAVSLGTLIPLFNSILGNNVDTGANGRIISTIFWILNKIPAPNLFVSICIFYLIVTVLRILFGILRDLQKTFLTQRILIDAQKQMFEKQIRSDLRFFINSKAGDTVFRIISLPRELLAYFTLLPSIFVEIATITLMAILLFSVSPVLFFIVLAGGFIFNVIIQALAKPVFQKIGKALPDSIAKQNAIVNEMFGGIKDILTYGKQKGWTQHFFKESDRFYHLKTKAMVFRTIPGYFFELLAFVGLCIAGIFYGNSHPDKLQDILPYLTLYGVTILKILPSFSMIGQYYMQMASYAPSVILHDELLKEKTVWRQDGQAEFSSFRDKIEFRDVVFSYKSDQRLLEGLNLEIPRNKTIAIVGSSGIGKSTIINLLLGFYDISRGSITIDGMDLKNYAVKTWRKNIGVVSQEAFIFNASIKENIAFDFTGIDMVKVIAAAKAARAHDFIMQLKNGYDTEVGDRGFKLSGGQRQRLAIARALYRNNDIIIFDEATSALDYLTEKEITETIRSFAQRKTVIILAHRLSTIENADIIYVLKDGKVVQQGQHQDLIACPGEYASLYKTGGHL